MPSGDIVINNRWVLHSPIIPHPFPYLGHYNPEMAILKLKLLWMAAGWRL
jgi:hypothetical protein